MLALVEQYDLKPCDIESIETFVYRAAMDVLGPVTNPRSVHQAKFSMGFVLALIARNRSAGVHDFSQSALEDVELKQLHDKVTMRLDENVEAAYPDQWSARVVVSTSDGRRLEHNVSEPKGDPGNPLSQHELEQKFTMLAGLHSKVCNSEIHRLMETYRYLEEISDIGKTFRIGV